jgi:hypothetical protein
VNEGVVDYRARRKDRSSAPSRRRGVADACYAIEHPRDRKFDDALRCRLCGGGVVPDECAFVPSIEMATVHSPVDAPLSAI